VPPEDNFCKLGYELVSLICGLEDSRLRFPVVNLASGCSCSFLYI